MYECEECGSVFWEPEYYSEQYEYWGYIVYEDLPGCPYCSGSYRRIVEKEDDEYDEERAVIQGWSGICGWRELSPLSLSA